MKTGVLVKIHESAGNSILAVADEDLIGKTFDEGDLHLEITERFYKGEEKSEEEIIALMKGSTNTNIVGEKSIAIALKAGIITEDSVIKIQGIPHAISIEYGS